MPDLKEVEGLVESIVYYNSENHFCIARLKEKVSRELVVIRGTLFQLRVGESIRLTGTMVMDPRFGEQIQVQSFQQLTPKTVEGIRRYLGSGLIPGIGPGYADKIVDRFGTETLHILEQEPQRLGEINGIGPTRLNTIISSYQEQKGVRGVLIFLQGHGVSDNLAMKIFKVFGDRTIQEVQKDPYILARQIKGVGFRMADRIARELNFAEDALPRIRSAVVYLVEEIESQGHCRLSRQDLMVKAMDVLQVSEKIIQTGIDKALQEGDLVQDEDFFILSRVDKMEEEAAIRMLTILKTKVRDGLKPLKFDPFTLNQVQKRFPQILLSQEQMEGIKNALIHKVSILTGGPGVGKTTILKILVHLLSSNGRKIKLCAPTGKASRRMEEACNYQASTLHRLLKYRGEDFGANEENPLEGDVFIVDEFSMVDIYLFHSFLKALPLEASLVFVGDVDQIPSVGPGQVLKDLIESGLVPTTYLRQIFRQGAGSSIVLAAHQVNQGRWWQDGGSDFFFIEALDSEKVQPLIQKMLIQRIPSRFGLDPLLDVQIMAPMYKGNCGIDQLNLFLQHLLNPGGESIEQAGRAFKAGDKVMQLENDYDREVFNGDMGFVDWVNPLKGEISVQFDDKTLVYQKKNLDQLALAYATSIHKVQGSEFSAVILVLMQSHFVMLKRNLLYTALTRGKKLVIVLGQKEAVDAAIRDTSSKDRVTALSQKIKKWHKASFAHFVDAESPF